MKRSIMVCCATILVAGCRSASPRDPDIGAIQPSPSPAEIPSTSDSRTRTWHIRPVMVSQRYQIQSTTLLELSGIRDSLTTLTTLTLNTQPTDTGIVFSGTIDSSAIRAGTRIGSPELPPKFPVPFAGRFSPSGIRIAAPSECTPATISPGSFVPRIAVTFPNVELATGSSWSDSVTFSSCNGEIPVSTTMIRSFRIVGEEVARGDQAILITRTDRYRSQGSGSQEQHRVELSSTGTGSARLWVTATSGRLIQSSSQLSGVVTVIASGRQQVFRQTVIEQTEARD